MTRSAPAEADVRLVADIRSALAAVADPSRAEPMRAYMKSAMPYLGVPVPTVRRIARAAVRADACLVVDDVVAAAVALWREAEFREHRYAATSLLATPAADARRLVLLPILTEMIVTGAWWDYVDEIAHRIGDMLADHPSEIAPLLRSWSISDDLWLRRVSIVAQLDRRDATDVALLSDVIMANLDDRQFFIRKAIGWALRQYARTDPDWVRTFVADHVDRLSPLSRREALKHLT